jgi:hypothetical protein
LWAEGIIDRLESAGLIVEVSPIVVHDGDQPDAIVHGDGTVKTSGGATATAPVRIVIDHVMPRDEAEQYAAALPERRHRRVAEGPYGVKPTGSVAVGTQCAGTPGAKPKEGYDFAIIDLEVSDQGRGSYSLELCR